MSSLKVSRQVMYPTALEFLLLKHHSKIANIVCIARTYNKNCPVLPTTVMQALVSTNLLFLVQREMYCCRSGIPRTSHSSKIFYELLKDRGQEQILHLLFAHLTTVVEYGTRPGLKQSTQTCVHGLRPKITMSL